MYRLMVLLLCSSMIAGRHHGYEYFNDIAGWLKLHRVPATWAEARLTCQLEGGVLASPVSKPMIDTVRNVMFSNAMTCQSCGVFTGIQATYSSRNYHTIEGIPLSQIPAKWAGTEQCKQSFKDCVTLLPDGTLSDANCDEHYPFACFRERINNNVCTADPAYTLDARTGSCYKFHNIGETWTDAAVTCALEGGHLAIINSDIEATVIRDIFARNPGSTIEAEQTHIALIGYLKWKPLGSWATITGQPLNEAGYSLWGLSQPDNNGGNQNCGAVFRTIELDDTDCDVKLPFICEIDF